MNEPTQRQARAGGAGGRGRAIPGSSIPIADVGSIHRLRWGDVDGDTKLDLVVAPIFGPKAKPPAYDDKARRSWPSSPWATRRPARGTRQSLVEHPRDPRDRGSAAARDPAAGRSC